MNKAATSEALLGHDVIEILTGYLPAIGCSPLQHFLQLLNIHSLSKLLRNTTNIVGVDRSSVVVIEKVENLIDSVLHHKNFTLLSLSPNFEVIPSRNSSKSTSRPSDSSSLIMLKIVGFFDSKPRLCMADLSSRGSILPVASVSNKLKASLSSSISS